MVHSYFNGNSIISHSAPSLTAKFVHSVCRSSIINDNITIIVIISVHSDASISSDDSVSAGDNSECSSDTVTPVFTVMAAITVMACSVYGDISISSDYIDGSVSSDVSTCH